MVKLVGPALSSQASGSLGDALTFSELQKRPYLKKYAKPKQPRTPPQMAIRAMVSILTTQWQHLSPAEQTTWSTLVPRGAPTRYHAFIGANMHRYRTWRAPGKEYPVTEAGAIPSGINHQVYPGVNSVRCQFRTLATPYPWTFFIFRDTASMPTQRWDRLIASRPWTSRAWTFFLDTPLASGTYYYRFSSCSATGLWKHAATERVAVVA